MKVLLMEEIDPERLAAARAYFGDDAEQQLRYMDELLFD